ncbi:urease accessory protein UreE [Phormidium sp. CCY1219]|jgi:urease accessory protein|uniref:urease accessory protein UreE n=1 Tax=Phormidium sp. CCY1219 TaxID=2886104 RepID=UPI002D1E5025|nr:urease accessory protein UreE [Phormidium sp. CCY1219]MEB3826183.1 urease accessory protein UreE [Phormidium sp. CCY1219]
MLTLTQHLPPDEDAVTHFTLSLTAEDRTRSRHRFTTEEGQAVYVKLPRGTVLRDRDRLATETGEILVLVIAKPEPVLTVTGNSAIDLVRAAYHLGNRHVSLEITATYLRLEVDSVLKSMLQQFGLTVIEEVAPFAPEIGAYGHHHGH